MAEPGQNASVEDWSRHMANLISASQSATSAWEQKKLEAQIKDANEGRKNAMDIAKLQSETSRYGVDATREVALKELKQRAFEFENTHALNVAKTATEYLSTPDRYFQAADFLGMVQKSAGGSAPAPYGSFGAPTPKSMDDFRQLYTGSIMPEGQPQQLPASTSGLYGGTTAAQLTESGGGAAGGGATNHHPSASAPGAAAQSAPTDPRVTAVQAVFKNMPPSEGAGMDSWDSAALSAAQAILQTNLRPGTLQKMRPGQQAMLGSAGRRLGWDMDDWQKQQERNGVYQGDVRAA